MQVHSEVHNKLEEKMKKTISVLKDEMNTIRAGRVLWYSNCLKATGKRFGT